MTLDPDRFWQAVTAVLGALIYGAYHVAILQQTGQPVPVRAWLGVLANIAWAALVGVILTLVLVPVILRLIPAFPAHDANLIAFAFGAFGWELLPIVFPKLREKISGRVDKIGEQP